MVAIAELWLPILVSAVFVFLASSVIHMALPIHKADFAKLPGEDDIMETMRKNGVGPGGYMCPCPADMKDMGSPEMLAKYAAGPVGFFYVLPNGPPAMGKSLVQWFLYCLVVGLFVGYIGTFSLAPGADFQIVFRVTGTAAFLGYALGVVLDSIWKGQSWIVSGKFLFDGTVYTLVTAAAFGWLWPGAA